MRNLFLEALPKIVHNISLSMKRNQLNKEMESNAGLSDDDSLDNERHVCLLLPLCTLADVSLLSLRISGSTPSTPTLSRRSSYSDLSDPNVCLPIPFFYLADANSPITPFAL